MTSFELKIQSWNIFISGYCAHGNIEEALIRLEHMKMDKISLDVPVFLTVLKACGNLGQVDKKPMRVKQYTIEGFDY